MKLVLLSTVRLFTYRSKLEIPKKPVLIYPNQPGTCADLWAGFAGELCASSSRAWGSGTAKRLFRSPGRSLRPLACCGAGFPSTAISKRRQSARHLRCLSPMRGRACDGDGACLDDDKMLGRRQRGSSHSNNTATNNSPNHLPICTQLRKSFARN